MKNILLAAVLSFAFFGCSVNNRSNVTEIVTYSLDYKKNDAYFWDTYFEYSHHVVLETNDESLFKEISRLIVKDNRIFILCSSLKKIVVFDTQGSFVAGICRYGEGPEEYLNASDMYVNDNNTIDVLDNVKSKINTYTLAGDFLESKKCIPASAFSRIDSDTYILNRNNFRNRINEPGACNFLCVRKDSVLAEGLPYIQLMAGRAFNFGEGNSLVYPHNRISIPHNDTLYVFDETNMRLNAVCLFDLKIDRPSNLMSESEINDYLQAYRQGEVPSSLYCLYDMGEYIFGMCNYNHGVKHVLISTTDGETLVSSPVLNKDGIPISPIPYTDDDSDRSYIASLLPSLFVKQCKIPEKDSLLSSISRKMEDEDANPVIIFWKSKKQKDIEL